jgi:serine protease Do
MAVQVPLMGDVGAAAAEVAERVCASVVEVRAQGGGAGAGTIWRPDGIILTNHHVVPRDRAEVILADGRRLEGAVVGRDPRNDLAALEVTATGLAAATIGDARALRVGELVMAIGHPFGVRCAVTVGVVSVALPERGPEQVRELVRADVLLGPGNSGGPLADARGRVVGINSMVVGGLALAIPSHVAARLVAELGGRPSLGIALRDVELPPALLARAPAGAGRGALVLRVNPGSAAEQAGLLIGDLLVSVDGRALNGSQGVLDALAGWPGGPIRLGLLRGGVPREVVVLPARPERRAA